MSERDIFETEVRKPQPDWDIVINNLNALPMSHMLAALSGLQPFLRSQVADQSRKILRIKLGWQGSADRVEAALRAVEAQNQMAPAEFFRANAALTGPLPPDQQTDIRQLLVKRRTAKYQMSEAGKKFLASDPIEGFRPGLYNDSAGHCTIGIGTLVHHGACNGTDPSETEEFKKGITLQRALQLVAARLTGFEGALNRDVKVELAQHQTDALLSFMYNTGGLHELLAPLNAGLFEQLPELIRRTRVAGNSIVRMRRRNEAELFEKADYNAHF